MATAFIQPPAPFVPGDKPALAWDEWRAAYEIYEEACEYNVKPAGARKALLLHVLGTAARKTYNGFSFPSTTEEHPQITVMDILNKFDELYKPYKNVTHASAMFNNVIQKSGQTVDELVTELQLLSLDCDYGDKRERMIGDRLIFGLRDGALRERLLRESSLTLDKIVSICKSAEIARVQASLLHNLTPTEIDVNAVYKQRKMPDKNKVMQKSQYRPRKPVQRTCSRCATMHAPRHCPAYGTTCNNCGIFGHFSRVCKKNNYRKNRQVAALDTSNDSSLSDSRLNSDSFNYSFIGEITTNDSVKKSRWTHKINVNNNEIEFKIDTGSDINILPFNIIKKWINKPVMTASSHKVLTYTGERLKVIGTSRLTCAALGPTTAYTFYIVDGDVKPILGADTSEELGLVSRSRQCSNLTGEMSGTEDDAQKIIDSFPDVFTGTGRLPGKYTIALEPDATPTISAPRNVPQALQEQVKLELQ